MSAPLEYRWKGMEAASCKAVRGQKCFRLWERTLCNFYQPARLKKAEEQLDLAVAADTQAGGTCRLVGGEAAIGIRRQIRGCTCSTYFESDPNMKSGSKYMVAFANVQIYSTKLSDAEKHVSIYIDILRTLPPGGYVASGELQ